jgi:hypothetical protein
MVVCDKIDILCYGAHLRKSPLLQLHCSYSQDTDPEGETPEWGGGLQGRRVSQTSKLDRSGRHAETENSDLHRRRFKTSKSNIPKIGRC